MKLGRLVYIHSFLYVSCKRSPSRPLMNECQLPSAAINPQYTSNVVFALVPIFVNISIHTYIHTYINHKMETVSFCMCVCMCVCVCVFVCVLVCMFVCLYACMYGWMQCRTDLGGVRRERVHSLQLPRQLWLHRWPLAQWSMAGSSHQCACMQYVLEKNCAK